MITDAILQFITDIFDWLLGTLPHVEVPTWLSSVSSFAGTVFGYANSMGVWFPSALVFTVVGTLLGVWLISYGIHVLRMIVSLFSGGGGKG